MKTVFLGRRNFWICLTAALLVAVHPSTNFASVLGSAETFAVLGGSTVTNTGPTVIDGDLGVSPGTAITGSPTVINGSIYTGADPVALQAHADAITAFNFVAAEPTGTNLSGQNLGGLTLTPGVYTFNTSVQLTGILTLDTLGDPNAIFHFQIGTTFTTAALSSVVTVGLGGAPASNIVWLVGTSATIGADTALEGTILAQTSISLGANASIMGRALAIDGAVTMDSNNISNGLAAVPEPNNLYCGLFGIGLILAKLCRDVRMKKAS